MILRHPRCYCCLLLSTLAFAIRTSSESITIAKSSSSSSSSHQHDETFVTDNEINPGFYTHINQRGLQLVGDYVHDRVVRFLRSDVTYNFSGQLTSEVQFSLAGLRIRQFDEKAFLSTISLLPGVGIAWKGADLTMSTESMYRISSGSVEFGGPVDIMVYKASINLRMGAKVNKDGHLKTYLDDCEFSINTVSLQFTRINNELVRNFLPVINRLAKDRLEKVLCPTFEAEVLPVLTNRLMNTPMSAALFDHYFLNYGLIGPVAFTESTVQLKHRGNAFGILRQGRTRLNDFRLPFRAPPLTANYSNDYMVNFYMSNYTLTSLLFWMDQYRSFDYEITDKSVNGTAISGYLRTECEAEEVCAGTLFPALMNRFPKGLVKISSHTVTFPQVRIIKDKIFVNMHYRIDAFVEQGSRQRRFLTAEMDSMMVVKTLQLRDYTLSGELKIESFKLSEVISLVDGINEQSLEFLVQAFNDIIISDDIATKLQKGIKLPIVVDFDMTNTHVAFEPNRIRIGSDFCFGDKCKRSNNQTKESSTADGDDNGDYYDQVESVDTDRGTTTTITTTTIATTEATEEEAVSDTIS